MRIGIIRACQYLPLLATAAIAQTLQLPYRPIDAEYSRALSRIVMVSTSPNRLHVYDPANGANVSVELSKIPTSVSVGPGGLFAAVGHDALISYVNLTAMSVERTFVVPRNVTDVVLAADYAYFLPDLSVNLSTGSVAVGPSSSGPFSGARLHPSGSAIYSTRDQIIPNDVQRSDVSGGTITPRGDSIYHDDFPVCGQIWFSPDGRRIYNSCATVFRSSPDLSADMIYATSFAGVRGFLGLDESAAVRKVAAIPGPLPFQFPPSEDKDNEVRIYESDYLVESGRFSIPDFAVGGQTFPAHGKWVFFDNSGSALRVIVQADAVAGLALDYVVHTIELANPAPCAAGLSATSANAIAEGGLATVNIAAAATCAYRSVSNAPWIQVVSGGYGSGNNTLTYLVRPNSTASQRTGTIGVGGQTLTVTQSAPAAAPPALARLAYRVADAEYRKTGDRLIYVTAGPDELHQYDAVTRSDAFVPLVRPPIAVSVRPDGSYAAVSHDGWISLINLQTLAVERVYEMPTAVRDMVLAGNGYIYVVPKTESLHIYSLSTATGQSNRIQTSLLAGPVRLRPSGSSIYFSAGLALWRWSTDTQPPTPIGYLRITEDCLGTYWLSELGDRIVTQCGHVYRSSETLSEDVVFRGRFGYTLKWAEGSAARQATAAIPAGNSSPGDTDLQLYSDATLEYGGDMALPSFAIGGTTHSGHGRKVFWDQAATKLIVLMEADASANLLSNQAIAVITPGACPVTLAATSASAAVGGEAGGFNVLAGAGCAWEVKSNASWLPVTTALLNFGPRLVRFVAQPNANPSARTGTITAGGQTFTVTQAGAGGIVTVVPGMAAFGRPGGAGTISVTTSPGNVPWTAVSNIPWVTITGAASGAGTGTVQYSVVPNTGPPRSGTLSIAGSAFRVSQAGVSASASFTPGIFRGGFFWLQDVDGNRAFTLPADRAFAFGGLLGDIPIAGDWNGDGKSEVGVYRAVNGTFLLDLDGDRQFTGVDKVINLGVGTQPGDVPVIGDWNGDGLSKTGLFRQGFLWILDTNGDGVFSPGSDQAFPFGGVAGDVAVTGDWDGDGRTNLGLFRQGFYWILDHNGNGAIDNVNQFLGDKAFAFGGLSGDVPITGEWVGGGITRVGIFRAGFFWVLDANGSGTFDGAGGDLAFPFGGIAGDKAIAGKW